jgi:ElaB/YqjD/DUF883 family membrane-anchored ribosome-binding protein
LREVPKMIDRILDRASAIAVQTDELKERAQQYVEVTRGRVSELSEAVKAYTVREPARALGIALGLGVFLGWMIKRR